MVVSICAVMVVMVLPRNVRSATNFAVNYQQCKTQPRMMAAAWLSANTPPGVVVSISDAGLVPARSGGRSFVDQFMLNEPVIQGTGPPPSPQRAEFVLAQRPDVIVLASRSAKRFVPSYAVDGAIHGDPDMNHYPLVQVAAGGRSCRYSLFIHRRVS